jgi:hypothetical protein
MNNDNDDDYEDDEDLDDVPFYDVDEDTRLLIETACNCIVALSEAQLQEESKIGLIAIADSLAERFGIHSLEIEEEIHSTDEGEEIIFKPKGGLFQEDEPEGPADANP